MQWILKYQNIAISWHMKQTGEIFTALSFRSLQLQAHQQHQVCSATLWLFVTNLFNPVWTFKLTVVSKHFVNSSFRSYTPTAVTFTVTDQFTWLCRRVAVITETSACNLSAHNIGRAVWLCGLKHQQPNKSSKTTLNHKEYSKSKSINETKESSHLNKDLVPW